MSVSTRLIGGGDNNPKRSSVLAVAASILLLVLAGPLLVIVNKRILRDNGLHLPAFVSAMGVLFTSVFTRCAVACGYVSVQDNEHGVWKLLPVGLSSAGAFMFGNMAYMYLDAGCIQMLKAGTPALLMLMLAAFRVEKISLQSGGFVILMVVGGVLSARATPTLSILGLVVMLLSQVCEGARCVVTQLFLQKLNFSAWDAGYHMAPLTAICCLILSAATEWPVLLRDGKLPLFMSQLPLLFASGCIGIAVDFASFIVIKLTSSLLTKLIVAARNAGLVWFFIACGEEVSGTQVIGYGITLVAFTGYSVEKVLAGQRLMKKSERQRLMKKPETPPGEKILV
jgi:drug/metabolite transporter (DMT)-like permease